MSRTSHPKLLNKNSESTLENSEKSKMSKFSANQKAKLYMPLFVSKIQTMLLKLKLNSTNRPSMERYSTSITMKSRKSERFNKKKSETKLITKTTRNKTKVHSIWTSSTDQKSLHLFNSSLLTCKDNNSHSDKIWDTTEETDHQEDPTNNNNNINQAKCHRNHKCNHPCHNQ